MKNSGPRCLVLGVHAACPPLQGVSPHRELRMNFSTGATFSGYVPEPASLPSPFRDLVTELLLSPAL